MRLIDADALRADYGMAEDCKDCKTGYRACEYDRIYSKMDFCGWIDDAPTVDAVPVRCKDCKHRPIGTNRDDLEFPDDKCPCKCEDYWYSWKPSDNWFCGNGERKDDEAEEITSIIGRDATTVDAVPVRT